MKATLDGEGRSLATGAVVASLLGEARRRAVEAGEAFVADGWGHRVGLDGAAAPGAVYFFVSVGGRPPAVGACLGEWDAVGGPSVPAELKTFLCRRAVNVLKEAGGTASARGTAAFAAHLAVRGDGPALWAYVAGEGRGVAAYPAATTRIRNILPDVAAAVIATRDVLTFRSGITTQDFFDGVALVEVATTNKVRLADYTARFAEVGAVAACRAGDFALEGFVAAPEVADLAAAAREAGKYFVRIMADIPLFNERGVPAEIIGDVVVISSPQEARDYDVVITGDGIKVSADARLAGEAAAVLWDGLRKRFSAEGGAER